ncbi:MAG: hypothetical protein CMK59_05825 [Proteobacteria bacterium]|nr:hypothetical protein [Pseudomonadota bacterium]
MAVLEDDQNGIFKHDYERLKQQKHINITPDEYRSQKATAFNNQGKNKLTLVLLSVLFNLILFPSLIFSFRNSSEPSKEYGVSELVHQLLTIGVLITLLYIYLYWLITAVRSGLRLIKISKDLKNGNLDPDDV